VHDAPSAYYGRKDKHIRKDFKKACKLIQQQCLDFGSLLCIRIGNESSYGDRAPFEVFSHGQSNVTLEDIKDLLDTPSIGFYNQSSDSTQEIIFEDAPVLFGNNSSEKNPILHNAPEGL